MAKIMEEEEESARTERGEQENVKVMVRCRPPTQKEQQQQQQAACVEINEVDNCVVIVADGGEESAKQQQQRREFYFDAVFGPTSNNDRVYMKSCRRLVESAFEGYNCTVFLYGQTGTGKTYTHSSLTLNSFAHLFTLIKESHSRAQFLIRASYYELYNEEIRDLLATTSKSGAEKPLELRESRSGEVYVKNLTSYLVSNLRELEKLKRKGDERRAVAATKMNEHSSRSHSIYSVTIERTHSDNETVAPSSKVAPTSSRSIRLGRLNLIDLAGSERQAKSGSTGARLKEASRINLSLTCLSLVIRSLTDPQSGHVPYRNSKLTRLLTSSLGGNSRTLLIACVSPARLHLDETLNTLRFASRTKRVKNRAKINEDAKDALLRKYRAQLEELKRKLDSSNNNSRPRQRQRQQQQRPTATDDDAIELLAESSADAHSKEEQAQLAMMKQQLEMLRAKIMVGGENLLDKVEMHEKLLEASKLELEERKREELNLKQQLQDKQRLIEQLNLNKGSLESQVRELDEKLGRALVLYKQTKDEQRDLVCEHQQLKESLLQSIRATSKEIRYASCIIDDFIPGQYLDLINSCAHYDTDSDEWQIKLIALSGNNVAQTKRFLSAGGASSIGPPTAPPDPFVGLEDSLP